MEPIIPDDGKRYRTAYDVCNYMPHMEAIESPIMGSILEAEKEYDPSSYTASDVKRALSKERLTPDDFGALLSPAATPFLEAMAERARKVTRDHFGNAICLFTPIYTSNYCDNRCVYCGFNHDNDIKRARLTEEEVEIEMRNIAATGLTDILILTGESRTHSDIEYIAMCVRIAVKHFSSIGIEVYPLNTDEYRYLHECGVDYVTVFQETYDPVRYGELHLGGAKRVFSYRLNAQERAIRGGMRGVGFAALLGIRDDWRKDAFSCGMHGYLLQRMYPHADIAYSLPRLRPCNGHEKDDVSVSEKDLLQVAMAYRLFMPFAAQTISTRELPKFRNGIVNICATKMSAASSVNIGGHSEVKDQGDAQFDISDRRTVEEVRRDLTSLGLQPIFNDYVRSD